MKKTYNIHGKKIVVIFIFDVYKFINECIYVEICR